MISLQMYRTMCIQDWAAQIYMQLNRHSSNLSHKCHVLQLRTFLPSLLYERSTKISIASLLFRKFPSVVKSQDFLRFVNACTKSELLLRADSDIFYLEQLEELFFGDQPLSCPDVDARPYFCRSAKHTNLFVLDINRFSSDNDRQCPPMGPHYPQP